METVLSSITKFLNHHRERGIAADLLARYTPDMEVQVLVGSANGSPVEGKQGCYTDGKYTWWNIRVSKNADSETGVKNHRLDWPLDLYADAIGVGVGEDDGGRHGEVAKQRHTAPPRPFAAVSVTTVSEGPNEKNPGKPGFFRPVRLVRGFLGSRSIHLLSLNLVTERRRFTIHHGIRFKVLLKTTDKSDSGDRFAAQSSLLPPGEPKHDGIGRPAL